jgi:phosphohistidine phosphatase
MGIIYLLRHASADPPADYEDDRDRDLSPEGQREARRLGQFLELTDQVPDQFVSSPAVRTRRTAELLQEGGAWPDEVPLRSNQTLYQAEPADVLRQIQSVDPSLASVMLVGHEPAWSTTVSRLLGSANVSLPPGTCVRIDVKKEWTDVTFGAGVLRWMVPPSVLRDLPLSS